jgi:hypothetical protein
MLAPKQEYWDEALGRHVGPWDSAWDPERFSALVASGSVETATTGRDTIPVPPPVPDVGEHP